VRVENPGAESAASRRSVSYVSDQLANERTFLAWLRTAVAMMGFGVVIVRLRFVAPAGPGPVHALHLGGLFAVIGLGMVPFATWHYFATRRAIETDSYQPAGASLLVFAALIGMVGLAMLVYVLTTSTAPAVPGIG